MLYCLTSCANFPLISLTHSLLPCFLSFLFLSFFFRNEIFHATSSDCLERSAYIVDVMRFSRTRRTSSSSSGRWCASCRVTYARDKKISYKGTIVKRWTFESTSSSSYYRNVLWRDVSWMEKKKETCLGGDTSIKVISRFVIYFWKFNNILSPYVRNSSQEGIERDKLSRPWNFA